MCKGNVLLLGGSGTLSTAVLNQAVSDGYFVTIMNRGLRKKVLPEGVKQVICDFNDYDGIVSLFSDRKFDVVVDFLSRRQDDIQRIYPFFAKKCKQYIFISSACVYRRDSLDFPIREISPKPNILWDYNIQKFDCEKKLQELSSIESTPYTIIRPYITYDDERIPLGIAPTYHYHRTIIERFLAGKPWFIWDNGKAITTITHTSDFSRALVKLFMNEKGYNEDFHITSDLHCSQKELVEKLFARLGVKPHYFDYSSMEISKVLPEYKGLLLGDRSLDAVFDNTKLKTILPDFVFEVDIDKGIDRVISYWEECNNFDYDYRFEARLDKLIDKRANVGFVQYPNCLPTAYKTYWMYRHLPQSIAARLIK